MDRTELLNFANKLEDDYKEKGYKWLYDKLRYEIIKKHQEVINNSRCYKSDSELLTSFAEYLKERDILTTKKENIPVRVDLFLKRG